MKKIPLFITIILLFSCAQKNKVITSKGIGGFILGEKIKKEFSKEEFDISLDSNNTIKSIIYRSKLFKTKNGFGVGTNLIDIEKVSSSKRKKLNISKGAISIGNIGFMVTNNNVIFVDENNNGLVDFVWIQKKQ